MNRDKLREELIRDEGLKLGSYLDTAGLWTIGVGHLLGTWRRMTQVTMAEAIALLDYDLSEAEKLARRCVPRFDLLSEVRRRALVNMAFNRGGHMVSSTTITPAIVAASEGADWQAVASAIDGSEWAQQVGARAGRLREMLVNEVDG